MQINIKPLAEAKLPRKFMLLGGIALFLVAVPFFQFFMASQERISTANRELAGFAPAKQLISLMTLMAEHRGMTAGAMSGNQQFAATLDAKKAEIEQVMAELDTTMNSLDDEHLKNAWGKSRQAWSTLAADISSRSITASASFTNHTTLIADYFLQLDLLLDYYQLSLDSDATNYALIQASYVTIPKLNEALSQLRGVGASQLALAARQRASGMENIESVSPIDRARLATALAEAHNALAASTQNLNKAITASPSLAYLQAPLKNSADSTALFLDLSRKEVVESETLTLAAADFFDTGTTAMTEMLALADASVKTLGEGLNSTVNELRLRQVVTTLIILLMSALGFVIALFVMRTIINPVNHLQSVMEKLRQGDSSVRAKLETTDEIGELARQFDRMVDEREAVATRIRRENEQLNESVLALLQGVAQLAQRDLTAKVPVAEDITGSVADALNLLSSETAKVLKQVTDISADVTGASLKVKKQSDTVLATSEVERRQIELTTEELRVAAQAMDRIGQLAQSANVVADNAIKTTQAALSTVTATVGGINSTRDTIRETEKRIKRLGERSQEISGVVGLINTIAERTHILALNASMHAASAGEAGRGFAVVAEEVQRLAENARQATAQISTLVNNIQVETVDTVNTMNAAISQVVDGSRLAEQAGEQMKLTQAATTELVESVRQIAANTHEQAKISSGLLIRAEDIRKSTEQTSRELSAQAGQTENLVEYARALLGAVRVFKLPA
jgi:methyl-accepting chemotaxis protein